jgi:4,5-dihydroxyphthalate decarboxylase
VSKLQLSVAIGDYDRTRALQDGRTPIDGVDPVFMLLEPEEIFFRAFRQQAFDIAEMSFSSFLVKHSRGESPYVAVPVFLSRAFRHTAIYVRRDRIRTGAELKGRRIGVPEYQLTANVWARALLQDDFGVQPRDVIWVRGGIETPGRAEKITLDLPADVRIENAGPGETISALLARGEIDAMIGPRAPLGFGSDPNIGWLYADTQAAATDYHRRSGIYPIMHLLGVRRELAAAHPWLPVALYKAFEQAKQLSMRQLADPSAPKVSLPFLEEHLQAARALLGADPWPYGVAANRPTLEAFVHHHHEQGLSARRMTIDELFHPSTYELASI